MIAAGIMSFSGVVVESSMNVTFPTLMGEFGISTAVVQWITTGYLLVLSIIIPTSSYLRRRFTMRTLFIVGASCFLAGTLAAALAPAFPVLLAGRLVQGVGTGVALPLMFNIILEQVPRKSMGLMIGIANFITSTAPAIGPSLGGFLVGAAGWRAVFWALVPLVLVSFVMGAACIRQEARPEPSSLDICGLIVLAIGFACFIFAANSASSAGWTSPLVLGLFAVAAVAIALFCKRSLSPARCPVERARAARPGVRPLGARDSARAVLHARTGVSHSQLRPALAWNRCVYRGVLACAGGARGCRAGAAVGHHLRSARRRGLDHHGLRGHARIYVAVFLACANAHRAAHHLPLRAVLAGQRRKFAQQHDERSRASGFRPKRRRQRIINTMQQLAGAIGTVFVSTVVASAQAADPSHMAAATATGTQQAFLLVVAFAAAEAVCTAIIFGVFKNRKRAV